VAPLDDDQRLACLRLIRSENVGPATFRALINHYGGAAPALASLPELSRRGGRKRAIQISSEDDAQAELDAARGAGMQSLFTIEPGYPAPLAFLDGAPPMLYVKGRTELLGRPGIAIVGSREASAAGIKVARQFAGEMSAAGLVIVSGLARGIDAAAHQASLAGGTVAVLAGGLDVVYPPEHERLQAAIGEHGCLVGEMPPGFRPRGKDFPRRNRIISGISRAVLVIEAAKRSGSLITARLAAEQGRDVYAVPGHPLDPRAEGTNRLLKGGAIMATSAQDILRDLRPALEAPARVLEADTRRLDDELRSAPAYSAEDGTGNAAVVLAALGPAPVNIDELARATSLPVRAVQIAILELSLAGRIEHHGAQLVSLKGV
jgi:DNA processing protein